MLQLTAQHRLLLALEPADFRRGIDGLATLCRQSFDCDPFSGAIFVFTNRRRTAVKILVYDGNGYWLCHKRFSKGRLAWWPTTHVEAQSIRASELQILLAQGNPYLAKLPGDWRQVAKPL